MPTTDDEEERQTTNQYTHIQLPKFNKDDPQLWFMQTNQMFENLNITNENRKYGAVVVALDPAVANEVRDIIATKPANNPYQVLKSGILSRLGPSNRENMRRLLDTQEMGDRKPTTLLRDMHKSAGATQVAQQTEFFKNLFLEKLPTFMQGILSIMRETTTVEKLAQQADLIYETHQSTPQVNAINKYTPNNAQQHDTHKQNYETRPSTHSRERESAYTTYRAMTDLTTRITIMETKMTQMCELLNKIEQRGRSQNRTNYNDQRNRSPSNPRYTTQYTTNQNNTPPTNTTQNNNGNTPLCWFHEKFGNNAHKCTSPCSFNTNQQQLGNANPDM